MEADDFDQRLRAILDDPQPMFPQSDPATEEPFLRLCELFLEANAQQRTAIRAAWPFGRMWRIPSPGTTLDRPGGLMTERRLMGSLLAFALQPALGDARDILVGLPIDYWVATQLGLDAASLFRRVAELAVPDVKRVLLDFLKRPSKSPKAMGWHLVETESGPRWKPA